MRVALTSGLSRKQVASDFGIGFSTLIRWIKEERSNITPPSSGAKVRVSHDGLIRDDLFWAFHILYYKHLNIRCCDDQLNAHSLSENFLDL